MTTPLSLENISHAFQQEPVLDDISCQFREGEATALIGPNGAGKTTLLKIAADLMRPDEGEVILEGKRIEDFERKEIASRVATILPAKHYIFEYTALEFVLMGLYPQSSPLSLPGQVETQRALRTMRALEVAELSDHPLSTLSEGERQRVLMARTMLTGASVWLLDEPVNSLDPKHQIALLEQVREHVDAGGTNLTILHNLSLVHRYFDRVLILKEGRLIADGAPDDILTSDQLSAVYEVQLQKASHGSNTVWFVQ
jgi:iron complex transport system ATP-binding protein